MRRPPYGMVMGADGYFRPALPWTGQIHQEDLGEWPAAARTALIRQQLAGGNGRKGCR